jgi:hypothetical protein
MFGPKVSFTVGLPSYYGDRIDARRIRPCRGSFAGEAFLAEIQVGPRPVVVKYPLCLALKAGSCHGRRRRWILGDGDPAVAVADDRVHSVTAPCSTTNVGRACSVRLAKILRVHLRAGVDQRTDSLTGDAEKGGDLCHPHALGPQRPSHGASEGPR